MFDSKVMWSLAKVTKVSWVAVVGCVISHIFTVAPVPDQCLGNRRETLVRAEERADSDNGSMLYIAV
jgi:hypothetical protein